MDVQTNIIKNEADIKRLLQLVDSFHDCLLKQIQIDHPGWVDEKGSMHDDAASYDLCLFFQSQFVKDTPPFKLFAQGVQEFKIKSIVNPIFDLYLELCNDSFILRDSADIKSSNFYLACSAISYCVLDLTYLGSEGGKLKPGKRK